MISAPPRFGMLSGMCLDSLGAPTRLRISPARVLLRGRGDTAVVRVRAENAAGFVADVPVDAARINYDPKLVTVTPLATGQWRCTAGCDWAATEVTVRAGNAAADTPVAIGTREATVSDLSNAARWRFDAARASGQLRAGAQQLRLEYDFTATTAIRTASAWAPRPIEIPGQPVQLRARLHGGGDGAWPSLECRDAHGTDVVLRGEVVDWTGWRTVDFFVPDTVTYPLWLRRFYLAETDPAAGYRGAIALGEITAVVPAHTAVPVVAGVRTPIADADTDDFAWRFAVLSDTQFVARGADPLVRQARRALRDIKDRGVDFLLINGDFVDEGGAADLALARDILEQELGEILPWVYVPGNHEIAGGDIARFEGFFGASQRVFDHRGARFITVDSARLRLGDTAMARLRAELDRAVGDDTVSAIFVVSHVPPHDPTGHRASRLIDRVEAERFTAMLSQAGLRSGKPVAVLSGHAGVFADWMREGVHFVVNGNSGKAPAAPPQQGGVLGWTECGVTPPTPRQHADRLALGRRLPVTDWLGLAVRRLFP